ncbi:hypothetical protein LR48_Vigan07g239900 [Vigna angularis]|uniref:Uncharacterized protein n=1 Tax=Phaseolus angularis TaxID=3914 RepID=A0A0L9V0P4_PHAAN|nr:hypothetical protein LR48_Vigan07g239900 [Vigna angularis]
MCLGDLGVEGFVLDRPVSCSSAVQGTVGAILYFGRLISKVREAKLYFSY